MIPTEDPVPPVEEEVVPVVEEPGTPAEVLAVLPEGTELNVVDENGDPLPLASVEAVEVLALPDPSYVCAGGTHAGTHNFGSINAAIADMSTCISGGGTIGNGGQLTVEAGNFTEDVVFDNSTLTGFTSIVGAGSGLTFLYGSIESEHLTDFLFQGFTVYNVQDDYIYFVGENGTITLNDLTSEVPITLANGTEFAGYTESYVLTDVDVNNPNGVGILIDSGDNATLTHVNSHDNSDEGANIFELSNLTIQGNENGDSSFSYNEATGLTIEDVLSINISDSEMRYNDVFGVVVNNAGAVIMDDLTLDANAVGNIFIDTVNYVTITDTVTTNSYGDGIYIDAGGYITLSGITSNWNGWGEESTGVSLDSSWGYIDISDSTFEGNYIGLIADNTRGRIILDHVIVSGTGFEGSNSVGGVLFEDGDGDIIISDSTVNDNIHGVLLRNNLGDITLTNVEINDNGDVGLNISGDSGEDDVEIVCSNVNYNGSGITIENVDDVTLSGVTATGNEEYDMSLDYNGELIELTGCKGAAQKEKDETAPEGKVVPVNGGENVPLDCGYLWTMLVLPEDSQTKFAGFCDMNAVFNHLPVESLPGEVPDGHTFVAGYSDSVEGSSGVLPNSGSAKLSLVVPETESGKELVVLFWDAGAGKWVVVPMKGNEGSFSASDPAMKVLTGVQISSDGKVTFSVNFTGTFVVASK